MKDEYVIEKDCNHEYRIIRYNKGLGFRQVIAVRLTKAEAEKRLKALKRS
jgi:hypothetical protein